MKALDAIGKVNGLAASQRGMFTSAQARALGVDRVALARLAKRGQVERVLHGVYRSGGAPSLREGDVLAAWMSLEPETPSYERDRGPGGFTASLNTAAWLHGLGELNPTPIVFSHPGRRQTRREGLSFIDRELDGGDVTVVSGIPATTPARTVLDLIDYGEDLSLVANALADAVSRGMVDDEARLAAEIDARAVQCGFGKGSPLYRYLRRG